MALLVIFAVIFAVFAFDSILVICVHRSACGKFQVSADWQRLLAFTSCTGSFSIRNDLQQVHCTIKGKKTVMGFEHLRSLEHQTETEAAVLGEFILDLDMEEHWKKERDYIVWNTVSLISHHGTSIPVFKTGKYVRRKYLHHFYTEAQLAILESCGLLVNVDKQCQKVLSQLQERMNFLQISKCRVEN
jgi:hypothetical protein